MATVGVLRNAEDAPGRHAPGLAQLEALLDLARRSGVQVNAVVADEPTTLSAAVELAIYRVIQESLTNVVRHADADLVEVTVRYEPALVVIEITDNGRARPDSSQDRSTGYGLVGMRERVSALGGHLEAGPGPRRGFRVHAELPIEGPLA